MFTYIALCRFDRVPLRPLPFSFLAPFFCSSFFMRRVGGILGVASGQRACGAHGDDRHESSGSPWKARWSVVFHQVRYRAGGYTILGTKMREPKKCIPGFE